MSSILIRKMKMTELKKCPFCGGEARIKTWCDRFGNWNANVYCINAYGKPKEERCQAEFFMRSDTQEKAIEEITLKWNNRWMIPCEEGETEGNWHTGTPTEEGEYLCWVVFPKSICEDPEGSWKCMWKDGKWYDNQYEGKLLMIEDLDAKIIAWQRIEPYKGDN